jgi:tetratricopeptide (TPR) repeat protein
MWGHDGTRRYTCGTPKGASLALCLARLRHGGPRDGRRRAERNAALEAERAAVFARMLNAPADRTLMAQYARLSIQLAIIEAAAATLERLIDLEPANATARLELATAYFAMGNYPLAEFHLNAAAASGALSARTARLGRGLSRRCGRNGTRRAGSRAPSRRGSCRPMARSAFWAPAR